MKVAISATGSAVSSEVDPRFGRAKWFLIFDADGGECEAIDNSEGVGASSGAGIRAARFVVEHGAECVLTGRCGPNACRALEAAGIGVIEGVTGTVSEVIEKVKGGQFQLSGVEERENTLPGLARGHGAGRRRRR